MPRNKAQIRADLRNQRALWQASDFTARDQLLSEYASDLMTMIVGDSRQKIAGFLPKSTEIGSYHLLAALAQKKEIYLPKVEDNTLRWGSYHSERQLGSFGIIEPVQTEPYTTNDFALILVPALAVSTSGIRLGQGGGYYDRALINTSAKLVAVIDDKEFVDWLPSDDWDVRMHYVLTPQRGLIDCSK